MEKLEFVSKVSKTGKVRDPEGMVRVLFRPNIIGTDLKISLLQILNRVKETGMFLYFMRRATTITIPK